MTFQFYNAIFLLVFLFLPNTLCCGVGEYSSWIGCQNCMSDCNSCSNGSSCSQCSDGHYYTTCSNWWGSQNCCDNCNSSCKTCNSSSSCLTCNNGYYLNTFCYQCTTGCSTCTSSTNCQTCSNGYYIQGTSCLACVTPCSTCITLTSCSTCVSKYYLSGNNCISCAAQCANCSGNSTNCTSCLDSANQTTPSCDCTSPSKYLDSNGYCQNCTSPCLNCSSQTSCDSCISKYTLSGTTCLPCTKPCDNCSTSQTNCLSCVDSTNQSIPTCQCVSGKFLNASYTCDPCLFPCLTCVNSQNYCLSCYSTYTYDSTNHTCQCLTTQYEKTTITPKQCVDCTSPCLECSNNSTTCNSCVSGLNRHLSSTQCVCDNGYFESLGSCQQCSLPCIHCTGTASCTLCNDSINQILPNCQCQNQFYMETNFTCQNCVSPCQTCTSSIICLTCLNNYYLDGTQCLQCSLPCHNCVTTSTNCQSCLQTDQYIDNNQCKCNNGYYMDNSYICQQCAHPCTKCIGDANQCTECYNNFEINPLGSYTCTCIFGYYLNSGYCYQCTSPCETCQNTSTQCLTCIDIHQVLNGSNQCICQDGYVLNGVNCDQCVTPCITCETSTTFCKTCKDTLHQIISGNCICQQGYLNDSNYDCQLCIQPCASCSLTTSHCTSCQDINHILTLGVCVCKDTYYSDTISTCQSCILPCQNCDLNGCLTCIDQYQYIDTNNDCVCQSGYYMVLNNCFPCELPCATCSITDDYCLSCIDSHQFLENNICICEDGYFSIGIYCQQCYSDCSKCVGNQNYCTQCSDILKIPINGQCICKPGYGVSGTTCSMCEYPCLECSLSTTICTSCLDSSLFQLQNNQCLCNNGYFMSTDKQCLKCSPQCQNCIIDSSNCLDCSHISYELWYGECLCPFGYYENEQFQCLECQQPCTTCTLHFNYCTSCLSNNQYLENYSCICENGYYMTENFECQNCMKICTKCSSYSLCNECIDGYWLDGNTCKMCEFPCQFCINQTQCLTCQIGYFLQINGQCEICTQNCDICNNPINCIQCQDTYFLDDINKCSKCDLNCNTCITTTSYCTTCFDHQLLVDNKCVCQQGYFELDYRCIQCTYPCLQCLSQNYCQECASNIFNLQLINNFCQCNDGYYWNQNQCQQCSQNCKTCFNQPTHCLSCDSFMELQNSQCVCKENYGFDEFNQCILCTTTNAKAIESCKYSNCYDSVWTYGEECDDGNSINRDGCSNCLIDKGYSCDNQILQQSICYKCPENCIQCGLVKNQIFCNKCDQGYYSANKNYTNSSNQCIECSNQCQTCESTPSNCTKCRFISQNNECLLCESKQGYHSDYKKNICYTICGDGAIADTEQCDDENTINNDGCNSKCQIETNYICKNGICIQPNYPIPKLQSTGDISLYNNLRSFLLTYNVDMNINTNLTLNLQIFENEQINKLEYSNSVTFNTGKNYEIIIDLLLDKSSLNELLIVKFENITEIISIEGYYQHEDFINVTIPQYIFIDSSEKASVDAASSGNAYALYIMAGLAAGSILFGGIEIFYNLLDTIQMLSYLKYCNTIFPYNLQAFFEFFGFAQLNFISKYFNIQGLIDPYIDFDKLKNIPQKIFDDEITSLFIINGTSLVTVWLSFFMIYILCYILPLILSQFKIKYYEDFPEQQQNIYFRFKLYFLSIKIFISTLCCSVLESFFYSGILRTHISTAYDYTFSTILQISALEIFSEDFLVRLSSYFAIIALVLYIIIAFFISQISNLKSYQRKNKQIQNKFGAIFEGIRFDQIHVQYCTLFGLLKKMCFMGCLIFFYEKPIYQVINLSFLTLLYSIFLLIFHPLQDSNEYRKLVSCESLSTMTLFMVLILTVDDQLHYLEYDTRNDIGWLCIGFITAILIIQVLTDAIQQWLLLIKKYKELKDMIEKITTFFNPKPQTYANHEILGQI